VTEVDNSNIHYAEKLKHFRYEFMIFIEKEEKNVMLVALRPEL